MKHILIVVTYNPDVIDFIRRMTELARDGVNIVIVDNCSNVFFDVPGVNLIRLTENLGISSAQNIGIKWALGRGAESVTFLDQDTSIDIHAIQALSTTVQYTTSPIAAPLCKSRSTGRFYDVVWWDPIKQVLRRDPKFDSAGFRWTNIAISSGLTVNCGVFSADAFMDECLFIDYVDTEWCLRMFRRGLWIRVVADVILLHEIGDRTLDFKFFKLPIHSPFRRYYRVRNSFLLIRYPHIPIMLSIRNIAVVSVQQLILALSCRGEFIKYLSVYFSGIRDAIRILRVRV